VKYFGRKYAEEPNETKANEKKLAKYRSQGICDRTIPNGSTSPIKKNPNDDLQLPTYAILAAHMKFVHPEILWAHAALAIPILVHLFNFRRFKKVLFSNVSFLQEIKHETKSKSKLKHLLILLSRMFAMSALIFAFAQPYTPLSTADLVGEFKTIGIYIDNSFSMDANNGEGRLLDLAKNKAIEIVSSYSASDKFQLLTNDFEGKHQRLVSQEEMLSLIQEVQGSAVFRTVDEVMLRQKELFDRTNAVNRYSYILNDLQKVSMPLDRIQMDTLTRVRLIPTPGENASNLYVDSLWFTSPVRQLNIPETMVLRLRNSGQEDLDEMPLEVSMNGEKKSVATVSLAAEGQIEQQLQYSNTSTGPKYGVARINDRYVQQDDAFYFSYPVADHLKVYHVQGSNATNNALAAVFEGDPYFEYMRVGESAMDYSALRQHQLVVLEEPSRIGSGFQQELIKFVENGGSLLVIPGNSIALDEYNALLQSLQAGQISELNDIRGFAQNVSTLALEHPLFNGIFDEKRERWELPRVEQYRTIALPQQSSQQPVMTLQGGSPYLTAGSYGSGRVYVLASSLDPASSNFITHGLFSTTMLRISEFSQAQMPLYYTLGSDERIVLKNIQTGPDGSFKLRHIDTKSEYIPEHRNAGGDSEIFIRQEPKEPGNYEVLLGDSVVAGVSFNLDRTESDTRSYTVSEITELLTQSGLTNWMVLDMEAEHLAGSAETLADGRTYWYSLIVFALIFLAIEILLIKFWK
jgi:hypothetical protein